jgi:hypothetical protein
MKNADDADDADDTDDADDGDDESHLERPWTVDSGL